jgi:ABC-type nitrate/sulfonate/bicarbonate transport system substrate-binding protein
LPHLETLRALGRLAFAAAALALVAGGGATAVRAQQSAPATVTYGILNYTAAEWPLMLAQDQGFFKKEGISVSVVSLNSPPNVINALASGAVNVAEDGTDSYIAAALHNLPIKIVAPIFAVDPYSLIVAPSITSIEQLKGKTIMLGTKQDVTAITLAAMIKPAHLTLDDFSIVVAGSTPARYQALISGNAQGSLLLSPFDLLAESQGFHTLQSGQQVLKNWLFTTLAVNEGWASGNRPAVIAMLRALREGARYGATHKQQAIASLIAYTRSSPEIAEKTYERDYVQWKVFRDDLAVTPAQLHEIAKQQIAFGVIASEPPFTTMVDTSYAAAARR